MKKILSLIIFLALLPVDAANIRFRDGRVITARIIGQTDETIVYQIANLPKSGIKSTSELSVFRDTVENIEYDTDDIRPPGDASKTFASSGLRSGKIEHRFSLKAGYMPSFGNVREFIPDGMNVALAYEICFFPCRIKSDKIKLDWTVAATYTRFRNTPFGLDGYGFSGGASLRFENFTRNISFGLNTMAGVAYERPFNEFTSKTGGSLLLANGVFALYRLGRFSPILSISHYYSYSQLMPLHAGSIQLGIVWQL